MHAESAPPIVVQKFGGSSVATPERLRAVAERVAATCRAGKRVVVVVSAMGKTTDQLLELARSVCQAPSRRELDMLLSTGERISMALLAMALDGLGVPAISFTGSQSGILTNDRHSGARIIEVRPYRIQDELERDKVVIVAGFQGMSYKREITTLGRGGSDTTAVALAAALGAESCEIYSDVDGVYTGDPRVVPAARRLDGLGHEEMQELAEQGAKVLNAQAVEWARKAGIVIVARATAGGGGETRVGGTPPESRGAVAVTGTRRLTRVRMPGSLVERALALCAEEGVCLRHVVTGEHAELRFVRDDLPDWPRVETRLRAIGAVDLDEVGAVSVVGTGVGSDARTIEAVLGALRGASVSVLAVDGSPLRLTVLVRADETDLATRAIHAAVIR